MKLKQENEFLAQQLRELQETSSKETDKAKVNESNYAILKHKFVFIPLALVFLFQFRF